MPVERNYFKQLREWASRKTEMVLIFELIVRILKGDASQIITMVEPEKVLINMEVNYFQDDSSFHLCIITQAKCKTVVGYLFGTQLYNNPGREWGSDK